MGRRSMSVHAVERFVRKVKAGRAAYKRVRSSIARWPYSWIYLDDFTQRTGYIACGAFNEVYSYGSNRVIRISKRAGARDEDDTSWAFLQWAQLEAQPWMPTVYQLGAVLVCGEWYYYAVLERLECIPNEAFYDADDALQEGKQQYIKRFGFQPSDLGQCNIMRRKTGEYVMNDPM